MIVTMRSDFLGCCALDPDLNVFINDHLEQIGPMSREELESAITDPARLPQGAWAFPAVRWVRF